jgi:glycerol-3-phosphate acyltransferase PlsY
MLSLKFLVVLILAFLIGSIPTAYLFVKRIKGIDIRKVGSGNVGASNAARILGRQMGILIFALDVLKGAVPTFFGPWLIFRIAPWLGTTDPHFQFASVCVAIAAFLGHCYTPFLMFKGGKGVATGLGAYLVIAPYPALLTLAICIVMILATRVVSLASIAGAVLLPAFIFLLSWREFIHWSSPPWVVLLATIALGGVVIFRHRGNLRRLRAGTEHKV